MKTITRILLFGATFFLFGYSLLQAEDNEAYRYKWVGTFVKGTPYIDQVVASAMMWSDFSDVIKRRWKEGYDLTEIKYGNGKWVGVFS